MEDKYPNQRKPKNPSERQLYDLLTNDGWFVEHKGWPDLACYKGNLFCVVEVKPKRSHRLKRAQARVMKALSSNGIICYRWSPDGGYERITPAKPTI